MSAKLYTKTGDGGTTSLLGGKRVSKANMRIEAYGTVDELNSFLGLLKDQSNITDSLMLQFKVIQNHLFEIGSLLAVASNDKCKYIPDLTEKEIIQLEQWIDEHNLRVSPLKHFILPGGHPTISLSHVCRTICRRVERKIVALHQIEPIDNMLIIFFNRLSDYFFIVARIMALEMGVTETYWIPTKND